MFPSLVAETLSLVCRVLPGADGAEGDKLKRGWESHSLLAPSLLTRPADRAASDHKEEPPAADEGKDPYVKQFASKYVPMIKNHSEMAQTTGDQLKLASKQAR